MSDPFQENTNDPFADHPLGAAIARAAAIAAGIEIDKPEEVTRFARMFWRVIALITSLLLIILLQIGFLFVVLGLLPAFIAYFLDNDPKKYLFKAIFYCNLSATLPYLSRAMMPDSGPASLELAMLAPRTWVIVYGSAFAGLLMVWLCRFLAYGTLTVTYTAREQFLTGTQEKLLDEWGTLVRKRAETEF